MRRVLISILILLVLGIGLWLILTGPNNDQPTNTTTNTTPTVNTSATNTAEQSTQDPQLAKLALAPTATVETSLGTFTIRFYTAEAPELTKNFLELAKSGYYDGLTFHRIIPNFVIQGGDPLGTGTGGHSYKGEDTGLADEPGALALRHLRGAVAWAKSSLPNSIGSQFYVALKPLTQLDGGYSVFGQVVSGMDVIDAIAAVPTDASDAPVDPVTITKVTVTD